MYTRLRFTALLTILALMTAAGCSDDEAVFSEASFTMTGFDSLKTGLYEAWVVNEGQYTSLGKFNLRFTDKLIDSNGVGITSFSSPVPITTSSRLAVTVEPDQDPMTAPSSIEILTGKVSSASISLGFKIDYTGRKGNFVLISPSDGGGTTFMPDPDSTNPVGGIWFIAKLWGDPEPGLLLDSLAPDGWMYEGWYMHPTVGFISTGKFKDPIKADASQTYFDPASIDLVNLWHYPGEDFLINPPAGLTFPLNLTATPGAMTFVTLEPEPDNSPEPFIAFNLYCKALVDTLRSNAVYRLDTPDMPSATVTLK